MSGFADFPWRHWGECRPQAAAVLTEQTCLTWRELCRQVGELAAGFQAQGIQPGDGVAIRGRNSLPALLGWLALIQCGARVLPLNPQLPDDLLAALLPGMTLRAALALDTAPVPGLPALSLQSMAERGAAPWDPNRFVSMTLTSGSTGLPKAAVHTAQAQLASASGVLAAMPYTAADCWLLSLPLFHVSGQGILWRWLLAGGRIAVRPGLSLAEGLAGCTHASLVPTQLLRLLAQPESLPALKAVLLGGAAIPVSLTQAAGAAGIACWCGYGMTEMASTVCAKQADGRPDVGTVLPGREVRIVNDEIWLRGESLAAGYWRDGVVHSLLNNEGWFATRDKGELQHGRLSVPGRLDNLFFSGGEGIQPEEVERVISTLESVLQVFIVPVEDREFGHRPVAVVECVPGTDLTTLPAQVLHRLARFQQPVQWLPLPDALKKGGIKISRVALRQWVVSQRATEA